MEDDTISAPPPQAPPSIPEEALKRWGSIRDDQAMVVPLTKAQIDDLLLSIRQEIISTSHLSAAFQLLSNGKQEEAQQAFNDHLLTLDHAWQRVNRLAAAIMISAQPIPDDANG